MFRGAANPLAATLYSALEELEGAPEEERSQHAHAYRKILDSSATSTQSKFLAVDWIAKFFRYFCDDSSLRDLALNGYFDLVEDDNAPVRLKAIRGLPNLCAGVPAVTGKIADVLTQLLNSEVSEEAEAAEAALATTIKGDVAGSVEALIKHAQDTEDPALASKAMSYLRRNDIMRLSQHASRKSQEAEDRLVAALMPALQSEKTSDAVFSVAAKLLFSLRKYNREPPRPKKEGEGEGEGEAASSSAGSAEGGSADAPASGAGEGGDESKEEEEEEGEPRPLPEGRAGILKVLAEVARLDDCGSGDADSLVRLSRTLPRGLQLALRTRESEHGQAFLAFAREHLVNSEFLDAAAAADHGKAERLLRLLVDLSEHLRGGRDAEEIDRLRTAVYAALKEHLPTSPPPASEFAKATGTSAGEAEGAAAGGGEEPEAEVKMELPEGAPHFSRLEIFMYCLHSLCRKQPDALMNLTGLDPKPKKSVPFTGQPNELLSSLEGNPMQDEARAISARLRALRTWCELSDGRVGAVLTVLRKRRKHFVAAKKAASAAGAGTGEASSSSSSSSASSGAGESDAAASTAERQAIELQSRRATDARRVVRSLTTLTSALLLEPAALLQAGQKLPGPLQTPGAPPVVSLSFGGHG